MQASISILIEYIYLPVASQSSMILKYAQMCFKRQFGEIVEKIIWIYGQVEGIIVLTLQSMSAHPSTVCNVCMFTQVPTMELKTERIQCEKNIWYTKKVAYSEETCN